MKTIDRKKERAELYDYLDGFEFYNDFEVAMAIHDFYNPHQENVSRGELSIYSEKADAYIKERKLFLDANQ